MNTPRVVLVLIFGVFGYFIIKYAAGIFLPFIIAYFISLAISPVVHFLGERAKLPRRLTSAVLVLLILLLIGMLLYFGVSRLYEEIAGLVSRLENRDDALISPLTELFASVRNFFSQFRFFETIEELSGIEDVGKRVSGALFDSLYSLLSKIPESLASLVGKTPRLLIGFFVTVMASYYFVCDRERIKEGARSLLPSRIYEGARKLVSGARIALQKYARGYLLLLIITFIQSFIGLAILGVRYSFLLALVISVVDVLPVLGAGTVLLPWAAVLLFMRSYRVALGLVILYGIMTIIRQILEPKIIGESLGLPPVVSLFSMYAGLRLFGVTGMILGPAVSLMVKTYLGESAKPINK